MEKDFTTWVVSKNDNSYQKTYYMPSRSKADSNRQTRERIADGRIEKPPVPYNVFSIADFED